MNQRPRVPAQRSLKGSVAHVHAEGNARSNTRSAAGTASQAVLLLIARLGFAAILLGRAWSRWQIEGMDAQIARIAQPAQFFI